MNPRDHAEAAAEAIRALNHATLRGGYEWPGDVDAVIDSLHQMARRLPQSLTQAITWLDAACEAGRIHHDQDAVPEQAVDEALSALVEAVRCAQTLARSLGTARSVTAHLQGDPS